MGFGGVFVEDLKGGVKFLFLFKIRMDYMRFISWIIWGILDIELF